MIAVLDYGMGNLRSVQKALEHVGAEPEITYDPERIRAAESLVLPGVGAFPKAMAAIRERGLDELVDERRAAGVPILGICLGMQLLFERSVELGGAEGLALLPGEVRALDAPGLKIPQIGWNAVSWKRDSQLTAGLGEGAAFYHVHSFAPVASNGVVLGTAEYGSEFVSAVAGDGVYGVQFHPEKSGPDGLALLRNFISLAK
ncbi:MAG: imidazole glycerol-phosphate synthase subunit HisH [Thermoleophilaceae bacterium]|nr:imidazole glycerol-phosphate synthase subunit HisH [Thermoleophilaceae bacterium]